MSKPLALAGRGRQHIERSGFQPSPEWQIIHIPWYERLWWGLQGWWDALHGRFPLGGRRTSLDGGYVWLKTPEADALLAVVRAMERIRAALPSRPLDWSVPQDGQYALSVIGDIDKISSDALAPLLQSLEEEK